jgi:transposase
VGVDAHKATHTLVAVDAGGRKKGEKTVEATDSGHEAALRWIRRTCDRDGEVLVGIEDVRSVSSRLERFLMDSGVTCVRVPTKMMSRVRSSARTVGKSDSIDALAVAHAVLRVPDLPRAAHDPASRACMLLVNRRDDLVQLRTALITRVHWRVHELDPERPIGDLVYARARNSLQQWLSDETGLVARLCADEIADIEAASMAIAKLQSEITAQVQSVAPTLLRIQGCGVLTAARITGEAAAVTRFPNEDAFASYAGLAPMPYSSGTTTGRVRRSKTGNRSLNVAIHRIAITQIRFDGPGRTYYQKRIDSGDQPAKARRALKRRLCRVVFRALVADFQMRSASASALEGRADKPLGAVSDAGHGATG